LIDTGEGVVFVIESNYGLVGFRVGTTHGAYRWFTADTPANLNSAYFERFVFSAVDGHRDCWSALIWWVTREIFPDDENPLNGGSKRKWDVFTTD